MRVRGGAVYFQAAAHEHSQRGAGRPIMGCFFRGEVMGNEQANESSEAWRGIPERALCTRRWQFLAEADRLFPWARWEGLIAPHYPKRGKGRPPYPLRPLLRLYLLRQWFALSDLAAQEIATDSIAVREFVGLGLTWEAMPPDETTLLNFRRLLDRHGLAPVIACDIAARLARQGWKLRPGEIAEAAMIAGREARPTKPGDLSG
jgi:IS5 family transposase